MRLPCILRVNGYADFLANYARRKTADDPTREALARLAAAMPGKPLRPGEWASLAVDEGLARTLFPATERDSERGRERAAGVLLARHLDETFEAVTEDRRLRVRLGGGAQRWVRGKNPHVRYVFTVLAEEPLPTCDHLPGDGDGRGGVGGAPLDPLLDDPRWQGLPPTAAASPPPPRPPSVVLSGRGKPPVVRGKPKPVLTFARDNVVTALLEAGDGGLSKDELEERSGHRDARGILRRLAASDPDWAAVISFPGTTGRRYRLL
jgi:hypothetical protein